MCGVGFDKLYEKIETEEEEEKKKKSFSNEKNAVIYFPDFKIDFLEPLELFTFSFLIVFSQLCDRSNDLKYGEIALFYFIILQLRENHDL